MITVLSFGAGQDSTYLLYRIALDPLFRQRYVQGKLIVIMSDTGDEHNHTYDHVKFIKAFCQRHNIEFHFIRSSQGFHPAGCPNLIAWLKKNRCIMSVAYAKTCTDNLKIKPIYNFLDRYIGVNVYHRDVRPAVSRKRFIKAYVKQHGKIRIILGIAHREEKRLGKKLSAVWMKKCLQRIYPLVETKTDRQDCQTWIRQNDLPLPPPSNCKRCPFLSEIELVWLFRFYPDDFWEWVEMELAKIEKNRERGIPDKKNLGVFGSILLEESLERALMKHGHMTDEELIDYKMSHGHCVRSVY